jgi:hypothetical protein
MARWTGNYRRGNERTKVTPEPSRVLTDALDCVYRRRHSCTVARPARQRQSARCLRQRTPVTDNPADAGAPPAAGTSTNRRQR